MIQFYPFAARVDCYISGQIVLRPRISGKPLEEKVLHRQQDLELIPEMLLESFAAIGQ